MNSLNLEIEAMLKEAGASLVGCADISNLPVDVRESMTSAISIAAALDASVINKISNGPTREYFREYNRLNDLLADLSELAVEYLESCGNKAVSIKPTVSAGELDKKILETALPHKTVATRAGLGWIGKSALLITKQYGPAVRLATVLTDAEFETGEAVDDSLCGDCQKCVDICPGGAIKGVNWVAGTQRETIYDAFACCKKAMELAAKVDVDAAICGLCINVCPWTQKYISRELTL
jgi:epoxyqueuosine reductase QueG